MSRKVTTEGVFRAGTDGGAQQYNMGQSLPDPTSGAWHIQSHIMPEVQNQEYYGGTTQTQDSADSQSQDGAFESTSSGNRKRKYKGYDEQYGMSDWDNDYWKQDARARYQQTGYNPAQGSGAFENWKSSYLDPDHDDYQGDERKKQFQDRWAYYNQWNKGNDYSDYMS